MLHDFNYTFDLKNWPKHSSKLNWPIVPKFHIFKSKKLQPLEINLKKKKRKDKQNLVGLEIRSLGTNNIHMPYRWQRINVLKVIVTFVFSILNSSNFIPQSSLNSHILCEVIKNSVEVLLFNIYSAHKI